MNKPSGSWTSWDNTLCNPLASARMQTQSAWKDGYDSAKAEWVGLTEEEMLKAEEGCSYMDAFELTLYAEKIEAILKEKNRG